MPTVIDFSSGYPMNPGIVSMPRAFVGYRTAYYFQPSFSNTSTGTTGVSPVSTVYYMPIVIPRSDVFISALAVYVATGGTSSAVSLGIYTSLYGKPWARYAYTSSLATTSSATTVEGTLNAGAGVTLSNPGLYYLAVVSSGSPVATTMTHQLDTSFMTWISVPDMNTAPAPLYYESSGTLPTTATVGRSSEANAPCVFIKG